MNDVTGKRVLIVKAPYYQDITDALVNGALKVLDGYAQVDQVDVAGAFEIPGVISMVHHSVRPYDGYLALGCVIRGETSHYDIVAGESGRGLMDLSVHYRIPLANGILTVDSKEQALARAVNKDKGGEVAQALRGMMDLADAFAPRGDA